MDRSSLKIGGRVKHKTQFQSSIRVERWNPVPILILYPISKEYKERIPPFHLSDCERQDNREQKHPRFAYVFEGKSE
jgi:hypothetical protein